MSTLQIPDFLESREKYFQHLFRMQDSSMTESMFRRIVYVTHHHMVHPSRLTQDMLDKVTEQELNKFYSSH